jgi:hypothetical protein
MNSQLTPARSRLRRAVQVPVLSAALTALAVALPGLLDAPASASTSDSTAPRTAPVVADAFGTTAVAEHRQRGRFVFTSGAGEWFAVLDPKDVSFDDDYPGSHFAGIQFATTQAALDGVGIQWTFPGTVDPGPVSPLNDPSSCLTRSRLWQSLAFDMQPCDGSAIQKFRWTTGGRVLASLPTGETVGPSSYDADGYLRPGEFGLVDTSLLEEIVPVAPQPLTIDAPIDGSTVSTSRPTFSGTGDEDAEIRIVGPTGTIATTTVIGGTWSVTPLTPIANGTHTFTVIQRTADGRETSNR